MIVLPGPGVPGTRADGPGAIGPGAPGAGYAVLLDRDGTLIEDVPSYVRSPADIRVLRHVPAAARIFRRLGVRLAIVSNQAAVGRGLLTRERVVDLHGEVVRRLAAAGLAPEVSVLCPHAPEDGCACRKPRPGLLLEAARVLGVPAERTFVIGDAARDVEAARAAGMHPLLVLTGNGASARDTLTGRHQEVPADLEVCAEIASAAQVVADRIRADRARADRARADRAPGLPRRPPGTTVARAGSHPSPPGDRRER
jgi:D-glycero-D-manno-heptose 1,7-bisphosphate phosphatase